MNVFARSSVGLETGGDPEGAAGSADLSDCSIRVNSPGPAEDDWTGAAGDDAGGEADGGNVAGSAAWKVWIIRVNSPGPAGVCPGGTGAGEGAFGAGLASTGAGVAGNGVTAGLSELDAGVTGCFKREASRSSSEEAGAGAVLKIPVALDGTSVADRSPARESGSSNGGRGALMDDHCAWR